jgi:hypothetical protein
VKIAINKVHGNNIILKKLEVADSEFVITDSNQGTPVYEIIKQVSPMIEKCYVILKPGAYAEVEVDGQQFTAATFDDVLAEVEVENE